MGVGSETRTKTRRDKEPVEVGWRMEMDSEERLRRDKEGDEFGDLGACQFTFPPHISHLIFLYGSSLFYISKEWHTHHHLHLTSLPVSYLFV